MLRFLTIFISIVLLGNARAETFGLYTYSINWDNETVTITDYPISVTGDLIIPNTIDGRSVTSIGTYAFYNCSSLANVILPDSVTSIESSAFYNCSSLTSLLIPNSVTRIESRAFYNCSSLTSITLSDSVTRIESFVFYNCSNLTKIIIPGSVTHIESSAFYNCSSLTSLLIPSSVTRIASSAFYSCSSLTSITIPNSVTRIESSAFYNCSSLTSIIISKNVTRIESSVFYNCSSLIRITIPDGVTSIEARAFYNCNSLVSIHIPNSVTSIESSAFCNCSSLSRITIPDSVTNIKDGAFQNCSSLTRILIPNSVISIGDGAFQSCISLSSIIIGNSVNRIGDYAFQSCSNLVAIIFEGPPPAFDLNTLIATSTEPTLYYKSYPEAYEVYKESYHLPLVYLGPPSIKVQPQGAIASLTETINLSVTATDAQGSTLAYQWMRNGVNLIEKTAASLSINSLTENDTGSYQVKVSNSQGTTASEAATVTIIASQLYSQEQLDSSLSAGFNLGVQSVRNNAQAYGLYTSEELIDLRPGSSQLLIDNNTMTLQLRLQIQRSEDLRAWSSSPEDLIEVELPMPPGRWFYRFAIP